MTINNKEGKVRALQNLMKNTVKSSDVKPSSQTNKTGKTNDTRHNTGGAAQNRQKEREPEKTGKEEQNKRRKAENKLKRSKTDSEQNYAVKSGGKERRESGTKGRENARVCVGGGGGGGGQISHHTSNSRSIRICLVWLASVSSVKEKYLKSAHL